MDILATGKQLNLSRAENQEPRPIKHLEAATTLAAAPIHGSPLKSILATNINISNVPRSASNSVAVDKHSQEANMSASSSAVVSSQRVKKVIIETSLVDDEIQQREAYLNHLKSIDLSKYSFPNEYDSKKKLFKF